MDTAFQTLALKLGIQLPERFSALLDLAHSGTGAMRSVEDLFWLDAEEAEREIDEWLNPEDQQGRTFLPFANNGSGEPWCFVQLETGMAGITQALHYGQLTSLAHTDISSWVASQYIGLATDVTRLSHQKDVGMALMHEGQSLHPVLLPADCALLADLFSRPCVALAFKDGPRSLPRTVNAFISREEEKALLQRLEQPAPIEFAVLRDWMR
ncbi:SMI1/KNR4 family protein [Pseudomonas sp. KNUC1026]|uniref:SMI1/KNR4 family protein n=1 Tax=Pseudomonas sp. KNUC1026 TaxID=2893890 RepID=UPI001F2D88F8|nr:SMI1/KNR4 family protein [Pseudomonas sp. KNUC1026]UFH51280.1 SMI1/KNR4 family protein [Pseudomonas sp. KNUC1026]